MKKILIVLMIGLFFGIAPITLQASVGSNDAPVVELHGYTLNEVFFDVLHPLTEYIIEPDNTYNFNDLEWSDLGDNSLNDVFESDTVLPSNLITNGNFVNTANWTAYASTLIVLENIAYITGNGGDMLPAIRQDISSSYNIGDYYYIFATMRVTNAVAVSMSVVLEGSTSGGVSVIQSTPVENQWYTLSGVVQVPVDTIGTLRFRLRHTYASAAVASGKVLEAKNAICVNISVIKTTGLFGSMSDGEIKTILDDYAVNGLTTVNTPYFINYSALGLSTITKAEIDFWYAIYDGSTTLSGIEDFGDHEYYFYTSGSIYDYSKLVADEIYSVYNNKLFSTLSPAEIGYQAKKWESFDYINTDVLSMTDYLVYDEDGELADMLGWYQNYLDNIAAEELEIETISDNEKIILIIALILYAIGIFIALYTKNKIVFVGSSLLWFIPIVIIPNLFIIVFSSIMLIASILIAYYPNKESDFE